MLRRMIVPKKREQPKSTGSSDTSVYRRSEEAEAAILPGQPWFFRDCTEQPVQMKTDSHVIQMATEEEKEELNRAIQAYDEEQEARNRLIRAVNVEPDGKLKLLNINPLSRSLIYQWEIGNYTIRGHVHYRGYLSDYLSETQGQREDRVGGSAWITGVEHFYFPLPEYILTYAPDLGEANGSFQKEIDKLPSSSLEPLTINDEEKIVRYGWEYKVGEHTHIYQGDISYMNNIPEKREAWNIRTQEEVKYIFPQCIFKMIIQDFGTFEKAVAAQRAEPLAEVAERPPQSSSWRVRTKQQPSRPPQSSSPWKFGTRQQPPPKRRSGR